MSALIEVDGKFYRMRRGKLVEIPDKWVGVVAHPQTIRKRPSKGLRKHRKMAKYGKRPSKRRLVAEHRSGDDQ